MKSFKRNKENTNTISISAISKELESDFAFEEELVALLNNAGIKINKTSFTSRTYENKFIEFITRYDMTDEEKEFSKNLFKDSTGSYAIPCESIPFFKFLLVTLALKLPFFKKYNQLLNSHDVPPENTITFDEVKETYHIGEFIISKFSTTTHQQTINLYLVDQLLNYTVMKQSIKLADFVEALLLNSSELHYYEQVAIMNDVLESFEKAFIQSFSTIVLENILTHLDSNDAEKIRKEFYNKQNN